MLKNEQLANENQQLSMLNYHLQVENLDLKRQANHHVSLGKRQPQGHHPSWDSPEKKKPKSGKGNALSALMVLKSRLEDKYLALMLLITRSFCLFSDYCGVQPLNNQRMEVERHEEKSPRPQPTSMNDFQSVSLAPLGRAREEGPPLRQQASLLSDLRLLLLPWRGWRRPPARGHLPCQGLLHRGKDHQSNPPGQLPVGPQHEPVLLPSSRRQLLCDQAPAQAAGQSHGKPLSSLGKHPIQGTGSARSGSRAGTQTR